jgi:hypothetical protein
VKFETRKMMKPPLIVKRASFHPAKFKQPPEFSLTSVRFS